MVSGLNLRSFMLKVERVKEKTVICRVITNKLFIEYNYIILCKISGHSENYSALEISKFKTLI